MRSRSTPLAPSEVKQSTRFARNFASVTAANGFSMKAFAVLTQLSFALIARVGDVSKSSKAKTRLKRKGKYFRSCENILDGRFVFSSDLRM